VLFRSERQASEMLVRLVALAERSSALVTVRTAARELDRLAENSLDYLLIANASIGRGTLALLEHRLDDAGEAFASAAAGYEKSAQMQEPLSAEVGNDGNPFSMGPDDWEGHMWAMSLTKQGFVHLKAGRAAQALEYYERALSLVRDARDEINLGSVLHQIGNCASELEQGERAFESYLGAAKHFSSIQMEEYLSNSLGEAGYVLVKWDPSVPLDDLLPEKLISDGLGDVARQVARVFSPSTSELAVEPGTQTVRKLFGIVALVSFSSKNQLLSEWAYRLREGILRTLVHKANIERRSASDRLLLMHLDLTLALAGSLSIVKQPNAMGPKPTLAEVEHYARLCYSYFDLGWNYYKPFEWLATYLRRHRGLDISAKVLQAVIISVEEQHEPFSIPDTPLRSENDDYAKST